MYTWDFRNKEKNVKNPILFIEKYPKFCEEIDNKVKLEFPFYDPICALANLWHKTIRQTIVDEAKNNLIGATVNLSNVFVFDSQDGIVTDAFNVIVTDIINIAPNNTRRIQKKYADLIDTCMFVIHDDKYGYNWVLGTKSKIELVDDAKNQED